jgi:hypothetical protein
MQLISSVPAYWVDVSGSWTFGGFLLPSGLSENRLEPTSALGHAFSSNSMPSDWNSATGALHGRAAKVYSRE